VRCMRLICAHSPSAHVDGGWLMCAVGTRSTAGSGVAVTNVCNLPHFASMRLTSELGVFICACFVAADCRVALLALPS
jgi:hypothetical protein